MEFDRKSSGLFVPASPAIITRRGFLAGALATAAATSVMLPKPALAAFTLLAHTTVGSAAAGGTSAAINTTGADLIVWSISHIVAINPSYTDSKSNIWSQPATAIRDGDSNAQLEWRYCHNPTTDAAHTFTISGGGGDSFGSACITAWRRSAVGTVLDGFSTGAGNSLSATIQPVSLTPSTSRCLIITGVCVSGDSAQGLTGTIDQGFTFSDQVAYNSAHYFGNSCAYLAETAAAAKNPTFTLSGGTPGAMAAQSLCFLAAPTQGNGFFHSFPP